VRGTDKELGLCRRNQFIEVSLVGKALSTPKRIFLREFTLCPNNRMTKHRSNRGAIIIGEAFLDHLGTGSWLHTQMDKVGNDYS